MTPDLDRLLPYWPLPAALLLGALVFVGLRIVARRVAPHLPHRRRARIVDVVAPPASVLLPLLFLAVALDAMPMPEGAAAPLRHALRVGIVLSLTWLGMRTVGAIERWILREHPVDLEDNLEARRVQTQARVIGRATQGAVALVGASLVLMTFPAIRQLGTTLLASAGVIGLVAGIAARPVFGNLIAGLQIALTQPIRLDDVVIVENEWGRVEEITSAYVVVRVWDERRMIVPLTWFIEHPFQNWTRTSAQLLGTAFLWLDYRVPMDALRQEFERVCRSDARWDGRVCVAQVTDNDRAMVQVRLLVSARDSGALFDLRCAVRERMIDWLVAHHPESLPRLRTSVARGAAVDADAAQAEASGRVERAEAASAASPGAEAPGPRPP